MGATAVVRRVSTATAAEARACRVGWAKSREAKPPPYPPPLAGEGREGACGRRVCPPYALSRQRQRRRRLDLFHGKAGRDVFERNGSDELLVERIVALNIR